MELEYKKILSDRYFLVGLIARILLIIFLVPKVQTDWFIPFITDSAQNFSLDPWTNHIRNNGDILSFPYGIIMYLIFLPATFIGASIDDVFGTNSFAIIGFETTILVADIALLFALNAYFKDSSPRKVISLYWFSPIVIYILYWYGQIDVIPVVILFFSLLYLKSDNIKISAALLGLAVASKLSAALALPLLVIYFFRNKRLYPWVMTYVVVLLSTILILQVPYILFSEGVQIMIIYNREFSKIYHWSVNLTENSHVYIVPIVYLLVLYSIWRLERFNSDLLFACTGIVFFIILILTPASIGWYFWIIPFLIGHQLTTGAVGRFFVFLFSGLFVIVGLLNSSGSYVRFFNIDSTNTSLYLTEVLSQHHLSLLQTLITFVGLILIIRFYRDGVKNNDYFRLSRKPLAIGIAGPVDSSIDKISNSIAALFPANAVTLLKQENYLLWNSDAPMWNALSAHNPHSTDLMTFTNHAINLLQGKEISHRQYDKKLGVFTGVKSFNKNDVVLIEGPHALYTSTLLANLDVSIFFESSAVLNSMFSNENEIDDANNNDEEASKRRQDETLKYISPQSENADLSFIINPINEKYFSKLNSNEQKLCLIAKIKDGILFDKLVHMLIGLCGLRVDVALQEDGSTLLLKIEGQVYTDDIKMTANKIIVNTSDILALKPKWESGLMGVVQLITLAYAANVLHGRQS